MVSRVSRSLGASVVKSLPFPRSAAARTFQAVGRSATMLAGFDPIFVYGNYVESILWIAIGLIVCHRVGWRRGKWLAAALFAFGVSDMVETRTGGWYTPWWMLTWKVSCVAAIVVAGLRVRRAACCPA